MKSYKVFILVVVGLIVINCGMLGAFWYQQSKTTPFDGPPYAPNTYLIKELKLTAAQQDAYETMRKNHFAATQRINRETRELKDQFFDNIKTEQLDTASALAIQTKINALQLSLDTTTLFHFRQLRKILTANQQEKFDQVIKNALRMMSGPHGRPPGGRGPNGMPPPPDGQMPPPPPEN
ncbi:MAG: periplasmic heavy metal sensor [Bacteroidota bacterium]